MKLKAYAPEPLNSQASILVNAQTDIKTAIKNGFFSGKPFFVIKLKVLEIIDKAVNRIRSPTLKDDSRKSLMNFANKLYSMLKTAFPRPQIAISVYILTRSVTERLANGKTVSLDKIYIPKKKDEIQAIKTLYGETYDVVNKGLPLQEYQKTYMKRVDEVLERLSQENAIDPNDITGRNSLRNLAEMQVRYERHQEEINTLKNDGVKLVVCSAHADCSDRCKEWQGRVYSLDGTSGETKDGKKFVPLEVATDVYYTTKSGRTYKNGLLGFNCRHKLFPYKEGMLLPFVSEQERKKEDSITRKQREMERAVIRYREEALAYKNGNALEYRKARNKALQAYAKYKQFSKDNGRAYYPDRVKIL